MKALVFYRPNTEHESTVLTYVRDFSYAHPDGEIELVNLNSREGTAKAETYGLLQYPAIVVIKEDDGSIVQSWEGETLPLMNELASYLTQF